MAVTAVEFAGVSFALPDGRGGATGPVLLRDICLTLAAGTTTAVLGRSGSGKTTLLRMVNRLVMPTSGEVRVGGRSTRSYDPKELRRGIGYVIQETGLFPHMTIERNAGLALELAGASGKEEDSAHNRRIGARGPGLRGIRSTLSVAAIREAKGNDVRTRPSPRDRSRYHTDGRAIRRTRPPPPGRRCRPCCATCSSGSAKQSC